MVEYFLKNKKEPLKFVLITTTGKDVPGITSALSEILNREGVKLVDMQQAVTLGILSLSIVIEFDPLSGTEQASVLKDLLFKGKELGVNIDFHILDEAFDQVPLSQQFAITLISDDLQLRHVAAISAILAKRKVNIDSIHKMTTGAVGCLEMIVNTSNEIDLIDFKDDLLKVSTRFAQLDIAVQRENLYRRSKRLIVMDMDSTLIQVEVIDELAKVHGVGDEVSAITEQAMSGHLDFNESIQKRVALLKGLTESKMREVAQTIPLTPGADLLIRTLKKLGYKIALISGGFSYFGQALKEKLGLHYVYTNVLEIDSSGVLTGRLVGEIVNAEKKAEILEQIAEEEGLSLESVIAIGDGANDIPMLAKAGLGIAFNGKKKTREAAAAAINQKNISSILYLLGITDRDIAEEKLFKVD